MGRDWRQDSHVFPRTLLRRKQPGVGICEVLKVSICEVLKAKLFSLSNSIITLAQNGSRPFLHLLPESHLGF